MIFQVYFDAKRLTLSANSWPGRHVVGEAAHMFDYNAEPTIPPHINLQYVNPPSHLSLLSCIVDAELNTINDKIKNCHAMSLRIDGSIDRTQIDKIYVMSKIVNSEGELELLFLGVSEQIIRGAVGLLAASMKAIEDNFNKAVLEIILNKVSSVCTDGANVNTGEQGGLWILLEKEILAAGSITPLIKIWCAAHRLDLAWSDLTPKSSRLIAQIPSSVKALDKILGILSSISSYFHNSAARTVELKELAAENGLKVQSMPKLFTIRWTEHTYHLIRSILVSWNAIRFVHGKGKADVFEGKWISQIYDEFEFLENGRIPW